MPSKRIFTNRHLVLIVFRFTQGPETGVRDRASYVLKQNKVRLIITGAISPDSPIAEHVKPARQDGVKVMALWVDDAEKSFYETVNRGATPTSSTDTSRDENGGEVIASIHTYGETPYTFVERKNY